MARTEFFMTSTPSNVVNEPKVGRSVSLAQAAELLGVSRRTIYNRIREGRLQTVRTIGGSQRVLLESVGFRVAGHHPTARPCVDVNETL
jgi:excisionase family DNA binding protein